tara:strand:+ start:6 stop:2018 length:2013 start_codon:yes stop_codon:yes gene_type:complete
MNVRTAKTKGDLSIKALVKMAISIPTSDPQWEDFRKTYLGLLTSNGLNMEVAEDKSYKIKELFTELNNTKRFFLVNIEYDPVPILFKIQKQVQNTRQGKIIHPKIIEIQKHLDDEKELYRKLTGLRSSRIQNIDPDQSEGNITITNEDLGGGGIISPKCPKDYDLMKDKCRCKKKTKKKKKVVKKPKKQTKKVDRHLETKKKLAQEIIDLHVSLGKKTGKLTTITQLIKLNVGDLRKDIKRLKQMERTKVRNVKKYVKKQEKRETKKKKKVVKKPKKQTKKKTIKLTREEKNMLAKYKKRTPTPIWNFKTPKIDIHTKKTPKQQKKIMMSRLRSYSPSVNKLITRKSVDQIRLSGYSCKEDEIRVDDYTCLKWKDKKTEEILLNNLKSKKPISAKDVLGPNQNQSNCWFNTFFMLFFISDKGRKFMKNFRRAMITGYITPNGKKKIPQKLRYPFWLLNKMVEASLVGRRDPYTYASLMDTNNIIRKIYMNLKSPNKKKGFYIKPGQAGNPVVMLEKIMGFFIDKKGTTKTDFGLGWDNYLNIWQAYNLLNNKYSEYYQHIVKHKPKIITIEIDDNRKITGWKKKLIMKFGNLEYKLDSVGVRDVDKQHICALITINGQEYMFDGENTTPLYKKKWRHLLNKNVTFKITPDIAERYNLTKGYQCLIYYRHK